IDACQNVDTCTFTVTVMQDTEPPTIRCPENITLMACMDPAGACGRIVNYPPPLAKDNSGSVAVTCTPPSGTFFPCGNTIVTCVAEDRCGNKDLCRFQVNIQPGGQPPAIQCPPEMVINTCSNTAVLDYPLPVAVPPGTTVTCTPPPGTVVPVGVY